MPSVKWKKTGRIADPDPSAPQYSAVEGDTVEVSHAMYTQAVADGCSGWADPLTAEAPAPDDEGGEEPAVADDKHKDEPPQQDKAAADKGGPRKSPPKKKAGRRKG